MRWNRGSLLRSGDGGRRVEVGGEALVLAYWMVAPRSADTHDSKIQKTSKLYLELFILCYTYRDNNPFFLSFIGKNKKSL